MYDLIEKKKRGDEHSADEINFIVHGVTDGSIPDYQISAWLMAVYFKGMTDKETSLLTDAMAHSGDMIDLSRFGTLTVDKHSTGGVGDKTSLVITPIVAALGAKVAKMSGRGLGHTGGTVDKLESLTGYRTALSVDEFLSQVEEIGIALVGQSGNLAPADKKLYALRDVTATVNSMPLIVSSIMSKKLAAGSHSIVLDVKCGSGAFMKTFDDARRLAEKMIDIGRLCGRRMAAVITDMDEPLGFAIGNSLEVMEALEVLRGGGPDDLREVCITLATLMTSLSLDISKNEARERVEDAITSGKALAKLAQLAKAQGANPDYLYDYELFKKPKYSYKVRSEHSGFINALNAELIGTASVHLGAGRKSKEDEIDFSAGIVLERKKGDEIKRGDVLATLYADNEDFFKEAEKIFLRAVTIRDEAPEKSKLIYDVLI
jgi:pyrimidine-nucleoside phosphorylase